MVHGLAEQFGGRFTLRSRPGAGTTAEIWLPIAEPQTSVAGRRNAPLALVAPKMRLNILAVDDDSLVLTNTLAMLEDLGHQALPAFSGKEALSILRNSAIDLVIADHAMPQMTGLQLAKTIREEWPDIPVILATGFAELDSSLVVEFPKLAKPFTQSELGAKLASVVEEQKSERPRVVTLRPRPVAKS